MVETKLAADIRTEFGKGAARRVRRDGKVPAVLYGHGTDPVHVALPGHATFLALKHANALLTIDIDGDTQLAIAKDVQRNPIRDTVEHVDLLIVRKGEKITVEVNVHVVGQSAPGTIHLLDLQTLTVEAEATHIPESIDVDIEGLEAGAHILAGDVKLPEGTTLIGDPEHMVVAVTIPQTQEEPEVDEVEGAEGVAEGDAAEADDADGDEG